MSFNFAAALQRKQDILAKSANADLIRARAGAGLQEAQANEVTTRTQQLGLPVSLSGLQQQLGGGMQAPGVQPGLNPALGLNQPAPTMSQPSQPPQRVQTAQGPRLGFGFLGRDEQSPPNSRVGFGF